MNVWRKQIRGYRAMVFAITTAVLLQLLFPLHYHVHHAPDTIAGLHDHAMVYHLPDDDHLYQHVTDGDVQELNFAPYTISKQQIGPGQFAMLIATLIILLLIQQPAIRRCWLLPRNWLARALACVHPPPLRAPPLR